MGRSLGVVVLGWVSGFLVAIAWGATRANNPGLASTLSWWAIGGMLVTTLLLLSIALSDRTKRRRAGRERAFISAAAEASAAERRTATRIARLEARLAREQEDLDAAAASLAAAELTATGHVRARVADPLPDAEAARLEPVLRREVLETVAGLVGRAHSCHTAELAGQLEALLEKAR